MEESMLDGGSIEVFNAKVMFELIISVEFTRWRRHSFFYYYSYMHTMFGSFLSPFTPPFPPALSLSPSTPSLPGRNYFALISNFVEKRV
jgi:hypothetical protein